MTEQGPKIVGSRTCPECGRRFSRLDPSGGRAVRRDCPCGKRWSIRFVDGDARLAERLGTEVVRLEVLPYADGRRRRSSSGQQSLPLLQVAPETAPSPAPTTRRRSVARGTRYAKKR